LPLALPHDLEVYGYAPAFPDPPEAVSARGEPLSHCPNQKILDKR